MEPSGNNRFFSGFSLVELSIVLVILGLLVGGILAGQSLIRAAQLRSVSTDYSRYVTAVSAFRDKYFALAGDMNNATSFWGDQATGTGSCASGATADGTPGTCNGDGDRQFDIPAASSNEFFRFWQHLALAGLIEGTYSGIEGSVGNVYDTVPGTNSPTSKLGAASWLARYTGINSGHAERFDGDYGNTLMLGDSAGTTFPYGAVLKPEEAWNIDTKLDDGKPATGIVVPANRPSCSVKSDGSAITTSAGDAALTTAAYALSATDTLCALLFKKIGS